MQIQFNTDESVDGNERLAQHATEVVERLLSRFRDRVTRVEVHVSDVNGKKAGDDDKRCLMEARIAGRQPVAVTELAGTVHQAIDGAAAKLKRALETEQGKLESRRRATAEPAEPDVDADIEEETQD